MQSWHPAPDGTDPDSGPGSWPQGYEFQDETAQFENSAQTWSQPLPGQQPMYTSIAPNATSNTAAFYPDNPHQSGAILGDGLNGVSSAPQGNFAGQGGLPQYRPEQDAYNLAFESLQQDAFGQQGKLDLDLAQAQAHQGQPSSQAFSPHDYASYPSRNDQAFGPGLTVPDPSKMLSGNAPALDHMRQQSQSRPQSQPQSQPPPQQQQRQQQQQQHPFQATQVFSQPSQQPPSHAQSFEHTPQSYSSTIPPQGIYQAQPAHGHPLNQQQAQVQRHAYLAQHPGQFSAPRNPEASQGAAAQYAPAPAVQQNIPQSGLAVPGPPTPVQGPASQGAKRVAERVGTPQSARDSSEQSASTEPAPKKRKRIIKKDPELQGTGVLEPRIHDNVLPRTSVEIGKLPLPSRNDDEILALQRFNKKRTPTAMSKFPPVHGAPYFASVGTAKLSSEYQSSVTSVVDVSELC
ncbi:hypothetical protein IMZ48_45210 [Candidatus Bathyarchaeota archaeon]|nr:hypothetical protein [Candidatus Bathyarchaeota archaeon]